MALTTFISGNYFTVMGTLQEVTGALGWVYKVPISNVLGFNISGTGAQAVAVFKLGGRGYRR